MVLSFDFRIRNVSFITTTTTTTINGIDIL